MDESLASSFFRGDYMPHGHCYLWQPHILLTHVISDILIAMAYFSIPFAILFFIKKRPDIEHRKVFVLFSMFILWCGITHLMGIWTIWQGVYGLHGLTKAVTAVISVTTAFYVYRLLPGAITIPTIEQFEGIKASLDSERLEKAQLAKLLENQKLMQFMFDTIPVSMAMLDRQGQIVLVNEHIKKEFGLSLPVSHKWTFSEVFEIESSPDSVFELLDNAVVEKVALKGVVKSIEKPNTPVEISVSKRDYRKDSLFVLTINSLEEYTQIEQELLASHQRLQRSMAATEDGIWEWQIKDNSMIWSPTMYKILGFSETMPSTYEAWQSHFHPNFRDEVCLLLQSHLRSGERFHVEYLGKDADGGYSWFSAMGRTSFNESGEPLVMSGSLRSIQSQKEMEAQEQEKESFLTAIYNGTNLAIWALKVLPKSEFAFVAFNETAARFTKVAVTDVVGRTLTEMEGKTFDDQTIEHFRANYQRCVDTLKPVEYVEMLNLSGEHWFQTSLSPVIDSDGKVSHVLGTAVEITQRKQAEQALEDSKQFLEQLIDNSVCGLFLFDVASKQIGRINSRCTEILGYDLSEMRAIDQLTDLVHPDDKAIYTRHVEEVLHSLAGQLIPAEFRAKHRDGGWVWCYANDSVVKFDEGGKPSMLLCTFIDISDNKKLIEQLKESNEYLERFAFAASHDLQEPLRKISAFSQSLNARLAPLALDEASRFEFDRLQDAAKRMRLMIKELLALSRINSQGIELSNVNLATILEGVKDDLSLLLADAGAVWQQDVEDCYCLVDEALMRQVFQNLITNSIKFVDKDQKPHIFVRIQMDGDTAVVSFNDSGIGISTENLEKVFTPFTRLNRKDDYPGNGIGLALVEQIVRVHKGNIRCESKLGEGTRFVIQLPRC